MRTHLLILMAGLLLIVHAGYADDAEQDAAGEEPSIVGTWVFVRYEVNGVPDEEEKVHTGRRIAVFTEDGRVSTYDDAEDLEAGEPDDESVYLLGDDRTITIFEDVNENGVPDDEDGERVEVMTLDWIDGNPVLSVSIEDGDEIVELKVFLERRE